MTTKEEILHLLDQLPQSALEKIAANLREMVGQGDSEIELLPNLEKVLTEDAEVLTELAK